MDRSRSKSIRVDRRSGVAPTFAVLRHVLGDQSLASVVRVLDDRVDERELPLDGDHLLRVLVQLLGQFVVLQLELQVSQRLKELLQLSVQDGLAVLQIAAVLLDLVDHGLVQLVDRLLGVQHQVLIQLIRRLIARLVHICAALLFDRLVLFDLLDLLAVRRFAHFGRSLSDHLLPESSRTVEDLEVDADCQNILNLFRTNGEQLRGTNVNNPFQRHFQNFSNQNYGHNFSHGCPRAAHEQHL